MMVVQVTSRLVAGRRQRIYCERFSLTPESGVDLEESAAVRIRRHCSQVLMARIAYCQVLSST